MSRFKLFFKLSRFGIRDGIILLVTCILTIVFDLTYGVLGGVVVTLLVNVKNFKKGLKITTNQNQTISLSGVLFFANADKLIREVEKISENLSIINIDLTEIDSIDQTALEKLSNLRKKLVKNNKTLNLRNANEKTRKRIDKFLTII